jgi:hypothetical protein
LVVFLVVAMSLIGSFLLLVIIPILWGAVQYAYGII